MNEEKALAKVDFADIFIKHDRNQVLNPFYGKIKLSESKGHLYSVRGKFSIAAAGYTQLNKIASINIVTPQLVPVDGVGFQNPFIERHKTTRAIEAVHVRKIGIGYSPIGNITVIDKTLFYNVYTYFIQSIQAKMKYQKDADPKCAIIGRRNVKPDKPGSWAFYLTAEPLGLWVNYESQEIIDCLEEHTQRQRFGDRIAQKIVERNIMKDHPAIGVSRVETTGKEKFHMAEVIVHGWRHDQGSSEINQIKERAEKGEDLAEKEIIDAVDIEEEKEVLAETKDTEDTEATKSDLFGKDK